MANGFSTSQKSERFAGHQKPGALPRGLLILMLAVTAWVAAIGALSGLQQVLALLS